METKEKTETCAHPQCNCPAPMDGEYCSEYCKTAASSTDIECKCGHPECQ